MLSAGAGRAAGLGSGVAGPDGDKVLELFGQAETQLKECFHIHRDTAKAVVDKDQLLRRTRGRIGHLFASTEPAACSLRIGSRDASRRRADTSMAETSFKLHLADIIDAQV